ncbi:hypothetical protein GCM10025784_17260 [Citricoccus nitrophenolicus]
MSTTKQDLDRQTAALRQEGIAAKRIYIDKKSGATTNRPGLHAALDEARAGDVIVVHTLDRLGRTVRHTLNLIHDLADRGVGVRNLADPTGSTSPTPRTRCRNWRWRCSPSSVKWTAPTPSNAPPTTTAHRRGAAPQSRRHPTPDTRQE